MPNNNEIYICGFNMSSLTPNWKLGVSIAGIFILYICFGALQEAIFSANDLRSYSPFLTLYQFGIYSVLSFLELRAHGYQLFNPWIHLYALVAVLTLGSIALSNASVGFLNYPTQVIFKCCKMIPVLLGGVLIQGRRYSIYEVLAVLLMTLGLICFTLVDVSIQPKFTLFGVFLVSLALCCDGALGNFQEIIMKKYVRSNSEILFYSYSLGFCLLASVLTISDNLLPSFYFFNDHSFFQYGFFLFCLISMLYKLMVMALYFHCPVISVYSLFTTFRKAVSIAVSFIMFEKPFSQG
ncbi:putative udp-galactose transporter [Schistosoma mansoni]|uniref:putative udp-galactose transporter n=1 Tax=Schistosoma mansoni TaxID=6183 RepID=UPI00022DCB40|nr:putative udp-galactose transporter [Schistosoma mansoni]|eukprot:XP_018655027.1 putative udp-galactose transporter [Schistosoma mansoni]